MKKNLHRNAPLAVLLAGAAFALILSACVAYPENTWVTKVTDMKSDSEEEWKMEYDYRGRLTGFGNTPIRYKDNRVLVGNMEWDEKGEKMFSAVYYLSDADAYKSETHGMAWVDTRWTEVRKESDYAWREDSLLINSRFRCAANDSLVRTMEACYVYDKQRRPVEIISRYYDAKGLEEEACHTYLDYERPIPYQANLNMRAYIMDRDGLDTFLLFLLDLAGEDSPQVLPNCVRHCVNHGEAFYVGNGIYRMEGEQLVRMEIITIDAKLKERLDFGYYREKKSK